MHLFIHLFELWSLHWNNEAFGHGAVPEDDHLGLTTGAAREEVGKNVLPWIHVWQGVEVILKVNVKVNLRPWYTSIVRVRCENRL